MSKSLLFSILFLLGSTMAHAKRLAPAEVTPLVHDGIQYSAPHFASATNGMKHNGGYVEATDLKTHERLWIKEVYPTTLTDPARERDVQEVFIRSIQWKHDHLKVVDENGKTYDFSVD